MSAVKLGNLKRPTSKFVTIISLTAAVLAVVYYLFFTLDSEPLSTQQILQAYEYQANHQVAITLTKRAERLFEFTYKSFDGSIVKGQINYPKIEKAKYPVMIGMHAMGRSYPRWWNESLKGRPTVTQVDKITDIAIDKGYVVIAIDARYHGSRKHPEKTLRSIMMGVQFFGDKTDYQEMIISTILDYRVLLDWIEHQQNLDNDAINIVGYSMGGQMSLLLAGIDKRINKVLSIVPPYLDDKLAVVAPKNIVSLLEDNEVWLLTADDDENASEEQNMNFFNAIPGSHKRHVIFEGSHILPNGYVESLTEWF